MTKTQSWPHNVAHETIVALKRTQCWWDEAPKEVICELAGRGLKRGKFLGLVISKWYILVNSEVVKFKVFLNRGLLSGFRVNSVANFGFGGH